MRTNFLMLVRGLPGSGKTTRAKYHLDNDYDMHLEADMYHMVGDHYVFKAENIKAAHEWCYQSARIFLNESFDVVVSNTFTQAWEIQRYLDLASNDPEREICVVIDRCNADYGSVHDVPADVLEKMKARFEDIPGECVINGPTVKETAHEQSKTHYH